MTEFISGQRQKQMVQIFTTTGLQIGVITREDPGDIYAKCFQSTSTWLEIFGINKLDQASDVRILRSTIICIIMEEYSPQLIARK